MYKIFRRTNYFEFRTSSKQFRGIVNVGLSPYYEIPCGFYKAMQIRSLQKGIQDLVINPI